MQFAMNQMQKNPALTNTPMGQTFANILKTGNVSAGEEMANNILSSMGMTKEDALAQAQSYFGLK